MFDIMESQQSYICGKGGIGLIEGYRKTGRIFERENPFILLCPQCFDTLEATDDNRCYCFGCDVVWRKSEVKYKSNFLNDDEPVPYKP